MSAAVPPPERIGDAPRSFGPYRLLARIAEGRRSVVFAGTLGEQARPLAVRILRPDADPAEFEARIRAGAGLKYGGTPPRHAGVDGRLAWSDELIVGENLATLLHGDPVPMPVATNIVLGILETLAESGHTQPHGDIVPRHVLIGFDGRIHLRDPAGSLLVADDNWTGYAAPEQLSQEAAVPPSDVFQAGVLLFELSTGVRLFPTAAEALARIDGDEIPRPRDVVGDGYPLDLQLCVRRMLRPIHTARFPNAVEAAAALRNIVHATGPSGPNVIAPWIRQVTRDRQEHWRHALTILRGPTSNPRSTALSGGSGGELEVAEPTQLSPRRPALDDDTQDNLAASLDVSPTERHTDLASAVTTALGDPPTRIAPWANLEPPDSSATTSLDEIEDVGFEAVAPIRTATPPSLRLRSDDPSEPMTAPGDLYASAPTPDLDDSGAWSTTDVELSFEPLGHQTAPPAWGNPDLEAAFEAASWESAVTTSPGSQPRASQPSTSIPNARPLAPPANRPPLVDTIDDSSATALLSRDTMRQLRGSFEVLPTDTDADTRPLPARGSLLSEPPPLVPARSKQANIETQVVRKRLVDNTAPVADGWEDAGVSTNVDLLPPPGLDTPGSTAEMFIPPANVDTRISISDIREPSLVVPIADEDLLPRRRVPWLFIAAGISSAIFITVITVAMGRFVLSSSPTQPAPVYPGQPQAPTQDPQPVAAPTRVQIKVLPVHATVKLDGTPILNESTVVLRQSPVTVEASAPGYVSEQRTIKPGQADPVLILLQKDRK